MPGVSQHSVSGAIGDVGVRRLGVVVGKTHESFSLERRDGLPWTVLVTGKEGIGACIAKVRTGVHVPPNVAKLMCQRVMTSVAVDPGPLEPGWSGNGMACLLGERWEFPNLWCGR